MARTYTHYVTGERETLLSPQALVMGHFILAHGNRTQSLKEIGADLELSTKVTASTVGHLVRKKFLERQSRGVYRITRLGRRVFEPALAAVFEE